MYLKMNCRYFFTLAYYSIQRISCLYFKYKKKEFNYLYVEFLGYTFQNMF